jgi:hypothetical protein
MAGALLSTQPEPASLTARLIAQGIYASDWAAPVDLVDLECD